MPPRRATNLHIGHTYGVGSLLYRPRTVVSVAFLGRMVTYRAEQAAVTALARGIGRVEGREYTCSRRDFVRWLRKVEAELQVIHGR